MIKLNMQHHREFAEKFPDAHKWLVRLELRLQLEDLRRRGKKNLLNVMEVKRMLDLETLLTDEEKALIKYGALPHLHTTPVKA